MSRPRPAERLIRLALLSTAMRCLVTGGAGFIGSNLVDALITRGDEVTVIDDFSTGREENVAQAMAAGAQLVTGDVRDGEALAAVLSAADPEVVFHLAAQIDVRVSVQEPARDAGVNVLGTIAVLEAARAAGVRRVVNTSSGGALYGEADTLPTPEDAPIHPLAPYGQGKLAAEGYCELYRNLYGLSTVSVRPGNVFGPRQDVHGEAGVVAIFCGHLLSGGGPTVFGDGGQTRDWVEVSDLVAAYLLAAESDLTGPVNVGRGRETSVNDLVDALQGCGREWGLGLGPTEFAPERAGEVRRSCLSVDRARRELGWAAQVGLPEGLRRIIDGLTPTSV